MKIRIALACLLMCMTMAARAQSPFEDQIDALIKQMTVEEKVSQLLYGSPAIERLEIPAYNWWNEALHGVARNGRATVFPQPIGMAATFDADLIHRVASAISDEARAKFNAARAVGNEGVQYAGLTFWSPNINIFRDPRWGRGMETWGEDPYLTGRMGSAFVRGLQGGHPSYLKTAACAKHFAVHSGPEGDRHHFDVTPPRVDLWNTYLPAFRTLVMDARVEAVMCAYNRVDGAPCCGSPFLLQEILLDQWDFKGHILSDCWAINDFHEGHKVTQTAAQSAALAIDSGVSLNCGSAYEKLGEALAAGLITEAQVDEHLRKLLRTRFRLGLLGDAKDFPYDGIGPEVVGSAEHVALAREAAERSIVLLQNRNNVLPLRKDLKTVYVVGPTAVDGDVMLGNYHGISGELVTIAEGVAAKVDLGTRLEYRHAFMLTEDNSNPINWAIGEARRADALIVAMGLSTTIEGEEGESIASSTKSDRFSLGLPEHQLKYLRQLRNNNGRPLVVVLTGGSPIEIAEICELADAVLYAWYPGEQGGNAVADIIFGDASPSGKLPITFPKSADQLPAYDDYSMNGRTYRYMTEEPQIPFGFGLSYTTFEYGEIELGEGSLRAGQPEGAVEASLTLRNTGRVMGDEIVQLYVTAPGQQATMGLFTLRDFQRVRLIPGEEKTVTFQLTPATFGHFTEDGQPVTTPGEYKVYVGGSLPTQRSLDLGAPAWREIAVTVGR